MAEQERKLLDFETAVSAVTVIDVQISPDGDQIAYVTSFASSEEEIPVSSIWLVSADGGAPRRLTTSNGLDGSPRWSPDGKTIAFLSDRKERGKMQAYLISLSGGEAVCISDQPGGVVDLEWSPDGSKIAFTAMDGETGEEKKKREEGNDVKVVDADTKLAGLYVLDVPANPSESAGDIPEAKRISPEGLHIGAASPRAFSWSPDGKALAASSAKTPKAHYGFAPDLVVITLDGEVTRLGNFEGMLDRPIFSPDGSTLAFVACEDKTPSFFSLRTIPSTGGESSVALPKHEASFWTPAWLPDGNQLLATSEEGQQRVLRIIDPESRTAEAAFKFPDEPGTMPAFSMTPDGKRVAFIFGGPTSYPDVWVADLGGESRKLTNLNPWTADYEFGETREIKWTSFDGLEIQGLLILPVGYEEGKRYPLLLHIHGGPCGAWTQQLYANWHDWGQFLAQRGYAVLMPNPRGSSGRGSDFLCGIVNCYGEPDWQDLMTGVDYVIGQGIADPDQLVVGGWSGGGFLTNWTITHTDRFKAAISGAGIANWVSFQGTADVRSVFDGYLGRVDEDPETHWRLSPIRYIKNATTPTLIVYGEADIRVPPSQGYELYEGLKSRGVETELVLYPRQPHALRERKHQLDLLQRMVDWYDRHLGRAEA